VRVGKDGRRVSGGVRTTSFSWCTAPVSPELV
jgi:hypothetical protein